MPNEEPAPQPAQPREQPAAPPAEALDHVAAGAADEVGIDFVAQSRNALSELFKLADVQHIICIDDEFAFDHPNNPPLDWFAIIEDGDLAELTGFNGIPAGLAAEVLLERCQATWPRLDPAERTALHGELRVLARERGVEATGAERLAEMLQQAIGKDVVRLSLGEWRRKQADLVASKFDGKFTLLLIDQDFTKEAGSAQGGIEILRDLEGALSDADAGSLRCALLTNTKSTGQEHGSWDQFATSQTLKRSRFMLISKERLSDEQLGGFVLMLRLTILNPLCEKLRIQASTVYEKALAEAKKQVADITIYDIERVVFAASREEGVWEPDTLFRIFGMYLRREARKQAAEEAELRDLADRVRAMAGPKALDPQQEETKVIEIRRLELYEDADYLNKHYLPTDIGDIYEGKSGKKYILLAQPCDLMVRSNGSRKDAFFEATVVRLTDKQPKQDEGWTRLEFFDPQSKADWFVVFRDAFTAPLDLLDFCAMRIDGKAQFVTTDKAPEGMIPSWQHRHKELGKTAKLILAAYNGLVGKIRGVGGKGDLASLREELTDYAVGRALTPYPKKLFGGVVDLSTNAVAFECRRVRRLCQPWSSALLTRYNQYLSRAAFEHDFGARSARPLA